MSELRIITNGAPRDILEAHELSAEERADFDYLDWPAIERGEDSASFVRYKGELLDLGDLERAPELFPGWDGYRSDTFFSGVLMRWVEGFEAVVMGRYYS